MADEAKKDTVSSIDLTAAYQDMIDDLSEMAGHLDKVIKHCAKNYDALGLAGLANAQCNLAGKLIEILKLVAMVKATEQAKDDPVYKLLKEMINKDDGDA